MTLAAALAAAAGDRSQMRKTLCDFELLGVACHAFIIRRGFEHLIAGNLHAQPFCGRTAFVRPCAAFSAFRNGNGHQHDQLRCPVFAGETPGGEIGSMAPLKNFWCRLGSCGRSGLTTRQFSSLF